MHSWPSRLPKCQVDSRRIPRRDVHFSTVKICQNVNSKGKSDLTYHPPGTSGKRNSGPPRWIRLRAPPLLWLRQFYFQRTIQLPIPGISVGSGAVGTFAWNLSPVRVAIRGKMKSFGSAICPIRKVVRRPVQVLTKGIFRNSVGPAGGRTRHPSAHRDKGNRPTVEPTRNI